MLGRLVERVRHVFRDHAIRRMIRDAGWNTSAQVAGAVLAIVRSALVARFLGVSDFGRLAIVVSTVTLVRQILSMRGWEWTMVHLSRAVVARDAAQAGRIVKASYALGLSVNGLATLAVFFVAPWIAGGVLHEPGLGPLLRLQGLTLVAAWADDSSLAVMRVLSRFGWLAAYTGLASLGRLIAIVPALALGYGLVGVVVATIAAQVVASTWLLVESRRDLRRRFPEGMPGRLADLRGEWGAHARMLLTLSLTDTVKTIGGDSDPLIIGYLASAATVAPYRAAFNVVYGLQQLAVPLYMVFYPEMTKAAAAGDAPGIRRIVRQTTLLGIAEALLAAGALTVFAPWIILALYGKGFQGAVADLQIMAWTLLILIVQWANPLFVSIGRPSWTLILGAVSTAVKIALLFALVPSLGHLGAALAYLGFVLSMLPTAVFLHRRARPVLMNLAERTQTCAASHE